MLLFSDTVAFTFIIHIIGLPRLTILAKHSASIACGASSVIKNKIKSADFAASKAISSSSCPSKAPIPGTSVISRLFHLYFLTSLVVR